MVDVRDVAQAHIAAAFVPDANGRHIVSGHETNLLELGQVLLAKYGSEYPIPRRALPKWLAWLIGPLVARGTTRRFVARNVDIPFRADNSRSRRELGVTYRPMQESMEQMFQQMIDAGHFGRR